jgi:hypothetical protein
MNRDVRSLTWILIISFAVQFSLISFTFPISELLSGKPFLHVDSPYHQYQIYMTEQLGKQGLLRGYDPFFAAGYVGGITNNVSFKVPSLIATLISPDADPFVVYKIYYFFAAAAAAVMLPVAAYALGIDTLGTAISALLGILLWWNSDIRVAYNSGLVSSVFTAFAATAFAAVFLAALRKPFRISSSIALGLIGAIGFLCHAYFPIVTAFTVLPGLVIWRQEYKFRIAAYYGIVVAAVALAANLFWIIPSAGDRLLAEVTSTYAQRFAPSAIFDQIFGRTTILNAAILASALYAVLFIREVKLRQIAITSIIAGIAMILFGGLGPIVPQLATLQPNRFLPFAFIAMIPAAALGIARMISDAKHPGLKNKVAVVGLFALTAVALNAIRETRQETTYSRGPRRGLAPPEIRGEGPVTNWLREWIQNNTSGDARVLFEHTGKDVYDRTYISSYLGLRTGREFGNYGFPIESSIGFGYGRLFGRDIRKYRPDELRSLLAAYNVGWIITAEDTSTEAVRALPDVHLATERGGIHIFQVTDPPGLFLQGSGKVTSRAINRLSLDELSGREVVIRYHYAKCLRGSPPVSIKPVSVEGGGADPFIELIDPPRALTLSCS